MAQLTHQVKDEVLPQKLVWARRPRDVHDIYEATRRGDSVVPRLSTAPSQKSPLFWKLKRAKRWIVDLYSTQTFSQSPLKGVKSSQRSYPRTLTTPVPPNGVMVP